MDQGHHLPFSLLGLKYHLVDKANATADCLENQFTPHDLCEENHERQVEARVQALLEAVNSAPPKKNNKTL
jgi:hypothetical protein